MNTKMSSLWSLPSRSLEAGCGDGITTNVTNVILESLPLVLKCVSLVSPVQSEQTSCECGQLLALTTLLTCMGS